MAFWHRIFFLCLFLLWVSECWLSVVVIRLPAGAPPARLPYPRDFLL